MPQFDYDGSSIYFEEHGRGFPVLLLAPGAMDSAIGMWSNATINPLALYQDDFRLIAMDQRNAGRSSGPLEPADPWGAYARDQVALLDHLGIDRFHVIGCCIGGSFALKLLEAVPDRVSAAVLQQPVGFTDGNGPLYEELWRSWGSRLSERRDLDRAAIEEFGLSMWRGDFVVSVSRDFVRSCTTPLLVLPGIDSYHPTATGREVAALAPAGEVFEPWKDTPTHAEEAAAAVRSFLQAHTPGDPT
ncbi:MAG TPA: alpha/beta fold hydrolase [Acidimicrobiales bacterium]|nr:alpha/beta fold hydrolase [Acidimicrobiales bacterium]